MAQEEGMATEDVEEDKKRWEENEEEQQVDVSWSSWSVAAS